MTTAFGCSPILLYFRFRPRRSVLQAAPGYANSVVLLSRIDYERAH